MKQEDKSKILVTCSPGLADFVQREIETLGYQVNACRFAGVEIEGSHIDAMKLNLCLRTAYNVLYLLD
jgi:23S rRNA G2445 N2-methylase RlmL